MNPGFECNHGGMTNDTGGPSCVDSGNKTAANFHPWFNITHTKPASITGLGESSANINIPPPCWTIPYPNGTCPVHQSDAQIRQHDVNTASAAAHLPTIHCWDGTS